MAHFSPLFHLLKMVNNPTVAGAQPNIPTPKIQNKNHNIFKYASFTIQWVNINKFVFPIILLIFTPSSTLQTFLANLSFIQKNHYSVYIFINEHIIYPFIKLFDYYAFLSCSICSPFLLTFYRTHHSCNKMFLHKEENQSCW